VEGGKTSELQIERIDGAVTRGKEEAVSVPYWLGERREKLRYI
jgi:hypothetical protein